MHLILRAAADPNTKASMQQLNPPFERTTEARTGFSHSLKASLDRKDLIALAKMCSMQTRGCGSNTQSTVIAAAQRTASA